jgi:vacuolar protein sorting-associated protein 54
MLRDVEYLVGKLGKVDGFGDLGTYLMKIVEDKEIKVAPPANGGETGGE